MKEYNIEELKRQASGCGHEDCHYQAFYVVGELNENEETIVGYLSCGIHLSIFKEFLFIHGIEPKEVQIL